MSILLNNISIFRLCISSLTRKAYSSKSDVSGLVLGAYTENNCVELTPSAKLFDAKVSGQLTKSLENTGELKNETTRTFWGLGGDFNAVTIVGMGKKAKQFNFLENLCEDRECARRVAAVGCQELKRYGVVNISVEDFQHPECSAEGALLSSFNYQEFRSKPLPDANISYYNPCGDKATVALWNTGVIKANAQNTARCLMDKPANKLTPTAFGQFAQDLLGSCNNVEVEVHPKSWIESMKMGSFLSVAAGSHEEPRFLEITYTNADPSCKPLALVGKGVTFDTGGISIKPSANMQKMKGDMGGAACVVGAMHAIAQLEVPINMKCFIPMTDNMVSSKATRPGDVVTAMNGKTISVDNTDAEGRLILADALHYAGCFNPKIIVDLATLTGAISVALGYGAAAVFSNNYDLWKVIEAAGARTGDRVWRMPLWEVYRKPMTECKATDLQNVSLPVYGAGSCTAAGFLAEFIPKDTNWMHLDIAGVALDNKQPMNYLRGSMSGRPTRTLIEFIVMNQEKVK